MKKKTRLLILSVIATLAFSGAMASCGKDDNVIIGGGTSSSTPNESVDDSSAVTPGDSSDTPDLGGDEIVITINGSATMKEFETLALIGSVTGSEDEITLVWESSDETIATVDANGVVTAHKAGTVTITASGADKSATHELTIEKTNILHEIEFDLSEIKIYAGAQKSVLASVVFGGETLDDDEYGIEYTWEKVSGDDVATISVDGAEATFEGNAVGSAVYKVSTTVRGYEIEKTISVTVMENQYGFDIPNEKISAVADGYKTTLTFGSVDTEELAIGTIYGVLNGEPQEDELEVVWSTDSDVFTIADGKITAVKAGEGVLTGTTAYGGKDLTISLTVAVEKGQVALEGLMSIETAVTEMIELPAEASTNVEKVTIAGGVLFDGANGIGSIEGAVVTVDKAGMPCKAADLGAGKIMLIETDKFIYSQTIDVYTMIINNVEELDKWQEVAAENAVKEGLCIEAQKGLAYSGYFVLGDDIQYNKQWRPYKVYGELWALCYNNTNIWVDGVKDGTLVDGAFQEDWGAGVSGGFKGTFDGRGHYIEGIETSGDYSSFIVTMGAGSLIKDVAFTKAKIGACASLVADRGKGVIENVYVQLDSIESGVPDGDNAKVTAVLFRDTASDGRFVNNVVVDVSKADISSKEYTYVCGMGCADATNVYVVGDARLPLTGTSWKDGSAACAFWHLDTGAGDSGAVVGSTAELFANEEIAEVIASWDSAIWYVNENGMLTMQSVKDFYDVDVAITNEETTVNANTSLKLTTNVSEAFVTFALKEEVAGVSIVNGVVTIAADANIGDTFTVVATSLMDGSKVAEKEFTVAPQIIKLEDTMTVEVYNNNTITLPEAVEGTVSKITIGSTVVYDAAKEFGSIDGATVTVGDMPAAMSDLGDGVLMTVETDEAKYEMFVSVYTMIIDNAEELEQWYSVAADNALKAGLNIEAQKGFAQSGYFVLGADIEYNKLWSHIVYSTRWAACYQNINIWKDQSLYKAGTAPTADNLVDGAIVEDWGAGDKGGFRGVFDGNGYAIKGMEINGQYAGFIGTMGREGVLKNIAFTGLKLGQRSGLVERGGRGGFVENVYVDLASIESGVSQGEPTKVITQHGNTTITNVIVNVTACDFTGVEYAYLLNSAYNLSENIYVIDRDYLTTETKTAFDADQGTGATAFWHFNYSNDTGAKFATVADLLADEKHGAVVSSLGGFWKVEDGKLYFGDEEVVMAPEKAFDLTEYKTDVDKNVTLENEAFTVGSVWSVSINGGEAVEYTVNEEGKAVVAIDPATLDSYQAKVVLSNADKIISFSNVIAVTYITNAEELVALAVGGKADTGLHRNSDVAGNDKAGYYMLADDIDFSTYTENNGIVAGGYSYQKSFFTGVFDGNNKTIKNITVGAGGIFGGMQRATVKNVNVTNVVYNDNQGTDGFWGNYCALFADFARGCTFENINVTVKTAHSKNMNWAMNEGLLVVKAQDNTSYSNITIDASYLDLQTLLGADITTTTYNNVSIKAAGYVAIGYSGKEIADGAQNTAQMLTTLPEGVTFEKVVKSDTTVVLNTGADLPVYDGDVTALGFAEGTTVVLTETDNTTAYGNRVRVTPSSNFDYVDIQFSVSRDMSTLCIWDGVQGNYNVTVVGATAADGAVERKLQIFDAEGNTFSENTGFKANTLYTLRAYLGLGEMGIYISTFDGRADNPVTIYFNATANYGSDSVEA